MTAPVRIRLSRGKGFDLQAHSLKINGLPAVNVARPGPWGNPFVIDVDGTRLECFNLFEHLMAGRIALTAKATFEAQTACYEHVRDHLSELRGKNLACWCFLPLAHGRTIGRDFCHADVLLRCNAGPP